jgi:integrase
MPLRRPPYLQREISRHGRAVWYVRKAHGPRVRIKAEYGTPEFEAEYRAAIDGAPTRRIGPACSSLAWLLARYRETTEWASLSAVTRRRRENIFKSVLETAGHEPYARVTTSTIEAGRDRRAKTPHQARHFLDAMRGLFRWAHKAGFVKVDPSAGVHNLPRKRTEGFVPWSEDHVAAYEARWPLGTRQRVWLDVLLYTGLRRGDAVRIGRQHVRAGSIKTEKSGFTIEVPVIVLPVLQKTLDAGPCGDLTFIVGANGRGFTKESFGNEFKAACMAAGVPGSAHGVRKLAATRMADNGATEAQLMAVFGWTDPKMAAHYTRTANRRRLAADSIEKLNASRTFIPAPSRPVRAKGRKSK